MSTIDAQARYSRGAIALHWIIALLIMGNFIGAWVSEDMPRPEKMELMGYHKAFGMLILGLTVLRIIWRLTHTPPPLEETLKAWEAALAKVTHALFYFLMLAVPMLNWMPRQTTMSRTHPSNPPHAPAMSGNWVRTA